MFFNCLFFFLVMLYLNCVSFFLIWYNHNKFKRQQNQVELMIDHEDLSQNIELKAILFCIRKAATLEPEQRFTRKAILFFFFFFVLQYTTHVQSDQVFFQFFNKSFLLIKKKKINCYAGRETIAHTKPICKNASKHLYEWGNHNLKQIFYPILLSLNTIQCPIMAFHQFSYFANKRIVLKLKIWLKIYFCP